MVLEALYREFPIGLPWELFYADDLAIIAESLNSRCGKTRWKIMSLSEHEEDKNPCFWCWSGSSRKLWKIFLCCMSLKTLVPILFHAPSVTSGSGIVGRLANNPLYVCLRCLGTARPINRCPVTNIVVNGSELDAEIKFCYLDDMLNSGGG